MYILSWNALKREFMHHARVCHGSRLERNLANTSSQREENSREEKRSVEKSRAQHSRAEHSRTEQGTAEHSRTEQSKTDRRWRRSC